MLKRSITFEDYNGDTITETHYFNLSKPELLELEVDYEGGIGKSLEKIIEAHDNKTLIAEFKKLILLSYGQKSADGKRFIKSDELREEFSQTAAYSALFMELATDDKAAANFINGIIPKDLSENVNQEEVKAKTAEALGTAQIAASMADKENEAS